MNPKVFKPILLFIVLTAFIQIFYAGSTRTNLLSSTQYFPFGYAVHIAYYLAVIAVTFLFVGKYDFGVVGLKRVSSWKKFLLVGIFLALLGAAIKVVATPGRFGQIFYPVPYYVLVPAFLFLGMLIGLAEESAFRGYILKNFLGKWTPALAILVSSILFGIYHIDYVGLNYFNTIFWLLYVVQALTGGLIMGVLFYKTGRNLVAPIAYHSTNIIVGQLILWTPTVDPSYLLAVEIVINLGLLAIVRFLPIKKQTCTGDSQNTAKS